MKKLLLSAIVLMLSLSSIASGLNEKALIMKTSYPNGYKVIQSHAVKKWGRGHAMVVCRINSQATAVLKLIALLDIDDKEHEAILDYTINKSTYAGYSNESLGFFEYHVDWVLALYTCENQLRALNSRRKAKNK